MLPDWVFSAEDRLNMEAALAEARRADDEGEVPVGAVVVVDGEILARAANCRESRSDPTAHAEILALRRAAAVLGDWRLTESTLYVTLEPCPMCVSACRQARVGLVIWGAEDERLGACGSTVDLAEDPRLGPPLAHRGGLLAEESREVLRSFFAKRRQRS